MNNNKARRIKKKKKKKKRREKPNGKASQSNLGNQQSALTKVQQIRRRARTWNKTR
jgi:hypothetical protein